ncbi:MAG: peptidoglycan-associated lipoprotein Pal [Immundisolibacter sp.]|uniref:peptidoglycan-associated lipoprotein Pal n=1 Tax=Immundisolibacter sp. TaxID=1934948 RepID=UPI0019878DE0|nr:peptidoglycan-associated lipoprotein Pal [Immundisolibacter sp.]MBC7161121.1 peptidoglycan-associated lipoprotein Pal [Immundisolibacter sp.]
MKKFLYVCVIALTAVAATGCGKKATTRAGGDAASTSGTAGTGTGADGAYGAGSGTGFAAGSLDDPSSPLSQRKIYFGLDRYDVTDEYRSLVEAHAGYLRSSPSAAVTLEGHTDERGSREYNIALGERRSNAVRDLLVALGASASQITTVSYGEEKPASDCHDESCWSQNRRVEIVYTAR